MVILVVLVVISILGIFISYDLGYISGAHYISNYEITDNNQELSNIKPTLIRNGLAIYTRGEGNPILLFPYPHADAGVPMAYDKLADILVASGRQVISFDPPGAFYSTQSPTGDMNEMLDSAIVALSEMDIQGKVDVAGHSMSSLCALGFAINYPDKVNKLILIGSMSGFPAAIKHGMPGSKWKWTDREYWKVMYWGMKLTNGRGSLDMHKRLSNLMGKASFHDESYYSELIINNDDQTRGVPIRRIWSKNLWRKVDYSTQLSLVTANTLICVGKYDPQTPLVLSEELLNGIEHSRLEVFENSGHSPFVEEEERFTLILQEYLEQE